MDVSTEIYHLEQLSLYQNVKPYTMRYVPDASLPSTNVRREKRKVQVKDMRGQESHFSLDKQGFMIRELRTSMQHEDYDNDQAIRDTYLEELRNVLIDLFPGCDVDFISYLVSRSSRLVGSD